MNVQQSYSSAIKNSVDTTFTGQLEYKVKYVWSYRSSCCLMFHPAACSSGRVGIIITIIMHVFIFILCYKLNYRYWVDFLLICDTPVLYVYWCLMCFKISKFFNVDPLPSCVGSTVDGQAGQAVNWIKRLNKTTLLQYSYALWWCEALLQPTEVD